MIIVIVMIVIVIIVIVIIVIIILVIVLFVMFVIVLKIMCRLIVVCVWKNVLISFLEEEVLITVQENGRNLFKWQMKSGYLLWYSILDWLLRLFFNRLYQQMVLCSSGSNRILLLLLLPRASTLPCLKKKNQRASMLKKQ